MSLFVKVCLHRFESNHINITLPTVGTVPYFTGGFFDGMRCDTIPTWFRPVNCFFLFYNLTVMTTTMIAVMVNLRKSACPHVRQNSHLSLETNTCCKLQLVTEVRMSIMESRYDEYDEYDEYGYL